MEVTWTELKAFVDARSLSIQWVELNGRYYLQAFDGSFSLQTNILKTDPTSEEQVAFEASYKANGNKSQSVQANAFAAKTLPNGKNLFKRFTGIQQTLSSGSNTFTWTQSNYPWVKFVGIEIIGAETGDTCDLYVLDTATGMYSGHTNYPLNQFGFTANIAKDFYSHIASYDADLYQNLQLKFVYNSVSAKTIGINFDMNEVK